VYLKVQGVSPNDHPVKKEIERLALYVRKLQSHNLLEASAWQTDQLIFAAQTHGFCSSAMGSTPLSQQGRGRQGKAYCEARAL